MTKTKGDERGTRERGFAVRHDATGSILPERLPSRRRCLFGVVVSVIR
jgi:hypothetical protein